MRTALITIIAVLVIAMMVLFVVWIQPTPAAIVTTPVGEEPQGWKRVGGAALVGVSAYLGRGPGAVAGASIAQGLGVL